MKAVLVAEGSFRASRELSRQIGGFTQGERYADVLRGLAPNLRVDIYDLPDTDAPPPLPLESYDGIVITGSPLHVYEDRPEVHRQTDFARQVFEIGTPFFGSCWGLQVATVVAGGLVEMNVRGREIGFARRINLTEAGRSHPMHVGRATSYDAPAVHTDIVTRLAERTIVTATNSMSDVQAAEIRHANGVFWGVQYHPEYTLRDLTDVLVRYEETLIGTENYFRDTGDLDAYVRDLRTLGDDRSRRDIAWRYAIDEDLLDDSKRNCELRNWLSSCVGVATVPPSSGSIFINYNVQRIR
jgi:GMP synthase (glutamine-hydrolysing)